MTRSQMKNVINMTTLIPRHPALQPPALCHNTRSASRALTCSTPTAPSYTASHFSMHTFLTTPKQNSSHTTVQPTHCCKVSGGPLGNTPKKPAPCLYSQLKGTYMRRYVGRTTNVNLLLGRLSRRSYIKICTTGCLPHSDNTQHHA